MMNVLNGMAVAVLAAIIPNAAISGLLGLFPDSSVANGLMFAAKAIQYSLAPLMGLLVGVNFRFNPLQCACMGMVAYMAAGNLYFNTAPILEQGAILFDDQGLMKTHTALTYRGVGDVLNVLIMSSITAYVIRLIGRKLGTLTVLLLPIITGVGLGYVGLTIYPYISGISLAFGAAVNNATELAPYIMGPLVAMAFGFTIVSPLSSVALSLITGVEGIAAGAANVGTATAAIYLMVACFKANKIGVPITILFGAVKLYTPLLVSRPIMFIPLLVSCAFAGLIAGLMLVPGTTEIAGLGMISFIGPIEVWRLLGEHSVAYKAMYIGFVYFLAPGLFTTLVTWVSVRFLKFFKWEEWQYRM